MDLEPDIHHCELNISSEIWLWIINEPRRSKYSYNRRFQLPPLTVSTEHFRRCAKRKMQTLVFFFRFTIKANKNLRSRTESGPHISHNFLNKRVIQIERIKNSLRQQENSGLINFHWNKVIPMLQLTYSLHLLYQWLQFELHLGCWHHQDNLSLQNQSRISKY